MLQVSAQRRQPLMSLEADSFKPPCLLGYYPCISNPQSKDCAVMDTCSKDLFFCKYRFRSLLTEPTFHVRSIVLQIGIVRMAAALVLCGELLSVDVFEVGNDDSKRRQFNKRRIKSDVLQEVQRVLLTYEERIAVLEKENQLLWEENRKLCSALDDLTLSVDAFEEEMKAKINDALSNWVEA